MMESEIIDNKRKLRESINKKNIVTDTETLGLQRLLTFVEMPSFVRDTAKNHILLPDIIPKTFLVSQIPPMDTNMSKKSVYMPNKIISTSKNPINNWELQNIIGSEIKIDKNIGYMPINPYIAAGLRHLTYGSLKLSFSKAWQNSCFLFKDLSGPLSYSLFSEKNGARSLIICVQCYFLKNLLYSEENVKESRAKLLKVTESTRLTCLVKALTDILWSIGEENRAFVCLPSNETYMESSPFYNCDGLTERIQIFKFKSSERLKNFLMKQINYFTMPQNSGCILFLYSIVLTKGFQELLEDFQFDHSKYLLNFNETLTQSGINLILTGFATEFLHNGIYLPANLYGEQEAPKYGIKKRSEIGFLQYISPNDFESAFYRTRNTRRASDSQIVPSGVDIEQLYVVGSMLKTPKYPIWIVNADNNFGLLFSLNEELLTHWRAENNFQLNYLNLQPSQQVPCVLSICTRRGRTAKFKTPLLLREETKKTPILNHIINTKWFGCRIDWNNQTPFI